MTKKLLGVAAVCILFGLSVLTNTTLAKPSEPLTEDYAVFVNDPYPIGPNTVTINFVHDSYCNLYIYLYKFDSMVRSWTVDRYTRSGTFIYSASVDGVWRLKCYMAGYLPYWTDGTRDTFDISDPEPSQNNLGTDWARHPRDWDIYKMAITIVGGTNDPLIAAQKIKSHVVDHFVHNTSADITFRKDLDLLDELKTVGKYIGVCRSDAVILTAYARAVGIPARIIHLTFTEKIYGWEDPHYHAEFYVPNPSEYEWVPVDGDFDYFGITEANEVISLQWPFSKAQNPYSPYFYYFTNTTTVTQIPCENLVDSGFSEVNYPKPWPYTNKVPFGG